MMGAVTALRGCGEFDTLLGRDATFSPRDVLLLMSFACIAMRSVGVPDSNRRRTIRAMHSLITRVNRPTARAASAISVNDIQIGIQRFIATEARPAQRAMIMQVARLARMIFAAVEAPPLPTDVLACVMAIEAVVAALQ